MFFLHLARDLRHGKQRCPRSIMFNGFFMQRTCFNLLYKMTGAQKIREHEMTDAQKSHEYEMTDAQKKKIDEYEMTGAQKSREYEMTGAQNKKIICTSRRILRKLVSTT